MSLAEFLNRPESDPERIRFHFSEFQEEFEREFKSVVPGTPQHSALLDLLKSVLDFMESGLKGDARDEFTTARRQYYLALIVRECLVGDQVSPVLMEAVTLREVAAGRMAPDDKMRKLTTAALEQLAKASAPKGWRKLFAWRKSAR